MEEQLTIYSRTWPRQFLAEYERIGEALWFFLWLLTRVEPESGYFRSSFERVAEETGVGAVQLKYWLERLEREGYLVDESLDGKLVVRVVG
jgi:hypothetical protein